MSIVLKDGTVFPDLPSDVLAEHPYFVAVRVTIPSASIDSVVFVAAGTPFTKTLYSSNNNFAAIYSEGSSVGGTYDETDGGWLFEANEGETYEIPLGEMDGQTNTLLYSNHNILDEAGEIYFSNSTIFRLPDGTELPALPEGCFEKYPYGVIMWLEGTGNAEGNNMYFIFTTSSNAYHIPVGVGTETYEQLGFGGSKGFEQYAFGGTLTDWTLVASSTETIENLPLGDYGDPNERLWLKWSNHDVLTATAQNDDGTYEIAPDLYHKSDVNYRIYGGWLNSMANQARRLGGVSGALKPGEMETVFKGVTAGGGDGGLAPNERIYQVGAANATLLASDIVITTQAFVTGA